MKMTSRRLLDPATKLLLDAAAYIERHGWCQFNTKKRDGRVCLVGAMWEVDHGRASDEYKTATTKLRNRLNTNFIMHWNDVDGRTKDEVLTALRRAAMS
jgi:hypothetical protein